MVRVKLNRYLIRLLTIIFIYNALIINTGIIVSVPSTHKATLTDSGKSDSLIVSRCSLYTLIDNMESALNYGFSHHNTIDKLYASKCWSYPDCQQKSVRETSIVARITINKKASPIKINAPPITRENIII